ncbi:hypothetical protein HK104_011099 [Borealophlyctis nickersoniae]|nr:hypothetical protein HK104_011099 [Borealophlyctis nickersoniae]
MKEVVCTASTTSDSRKSLKRMPSHPSPSAGARSRPTSNAGSNVTMSSAKVYPTRTASPAPSSYPVRTSSPAPSSFPARNASPAPTSSYPMRTASPAPGGLRAPSAAARNRRSEPPPTSANGGSSSSGGGAAPIPIPYLRKTRSIGEGCFVSGPTTSDPSEGGSVSSESSESTNQLGEMANSVKSSLSTGQRGNVRAKRSPSVVSLASSVKSNGAAKNKPTVINTSTASTSFKPRVSPADTQILVETCRNCMNAAKASDPIDIELQANDRALRKIMDLEISNTSLLAVNTSLENTIRQQSLAINQMQQEIARLKGEVIDEDEEGSSDYQASVPSDTTQLQVPSKPEVPPSDPSQGAVTEACKPSAVHPESRNRTLAQTAALAAEEEGHKDAQVVYGRICAIIQRLVEDGAKAVEYRADLALLSPTKEEKLFSEG